MGGRLKKGTVASAERRKEHSRRGRALRRRRPSADKRADGNDASRPGGAPPQRGDGRGESCRSWSNYKTFGWEGGVKRARSRLLSDARSTAGAAVPCGVVGRPLISGRTATTQAARVGHPPTGGTGRGLFCRSWGTVGGHCPVSVSPYNFGVGGRQATVGGTLPPSAACRPGGASPQRGDGRGESCRCKSN